MVARKYHRTKTQMGGRQNVPTYSNMFKKKSPGLGTGTLHKIRKASGQVFRAPAYAARATSSAVSGLVGLSATRGTAALYHGAKLSSAKRSETREQKKINSLLGLEKTHWTKRLGSTLGLYKPKLTELETAKKQDTINTLIKKVQSLTTTGTSGKALQKTQAQLTALKKSLPSTSPSPTTALLTSTTLPTPRNGESYVNALRRSKIETLQTNATSSSNNAAKAKAKAKVDLYKLRTRKLTAKQAKVANADIQYKKSKKALGNIRSNTKKKILEDYQYVKNMSKKKIAALYGLALLGAPGATPVALIGLPIYDIVRTMGKDVPAIAKLGQKVKNKLFGSRGELMDRIAKRDRQQVEVNETFNKQNTVLTEKLSAIETTLLSKADADKMTEAVKTMQTHMNKINEYKIQAAKATDNTTRKENEQKIIEAQNQLKQAKSDHSLFMQKQYSRAKTELYPEAQKQLESVLDTSTNMVRLLDVQGDIQSRKRDVQRALLQKQKEDVQLLKAAQDSNSPVASALQGKTQDFNVNNIDSYEISTLKTKLDDANLQSFKDPSYKLAVKYFEALINLKVIKTSFGELHTDLTKAGITTPTQQPTDY